jgi:hypothetical protein
MLTLNSFQYCKAAQYEYQGKAKDSTASALSWFRSTMKTVSAAASTSFRGYGLLGPDRVSLAGASFIRSKPAKQAREISTRFPAVSASCKRLPLVTVGFEWSSPIQKMNFSSQRIWHSQVHLPGVSAKYRIR